MNCPYQLRQWYRLLTTIALYNGLFSLSSTDRNIERYMGNLTIQETLEQELLIKTRSDCLVETLFR